MFQIRSFDSRTISWWNAQHELIDFDPPYQRQGHIWSPHAKAFLIDTILNDFDVPKFYVADFSFTDSPLNDGKHQYAVIDGKQRFETIHDFYLSRVTLASSFRFFQDPSLELGGLSYRDLRTQYPRVASKFDNFNLSVMSVITDDESKINDLFIRLNSSKPLSAPELRNAMKGTVPGLIRDLALHELFEDRVRFKKNRGEDRQSAAKFLLVEFSGDLVNTKKTNLDSLVSTAERTETANDELLRSADRCERQLDRMLSVFISRDPLLSSQGQLVVYYWLIREYGSHPAMREFLLRFEQDRKANRVLAGRADSTASLDQELLQYDTLNRSINDESSLKGRFKILSSRWRRREAR